MWFWHVSNSVVIRWISDQQNIFNQCLGKLHNLHNKRKFYLILVYVYYIILNFVVILHVVNAYRYKIKVLKLHTKVTYQWKNNSNLILGWYIKNKNVQYKYNWQILDCAANMFILIIMDVSCTLFLNGSFIFQDHVYGTSMHDIHAHRLATRSSRSTIHIHNKILIRMHMTKEKL